MSYGMTINSYEKDNLRSGSFPMETIPITLLTGNNLVRGTVLGKITASGKYTAYNDGAADGSQTAVGVLLEDVDATDKDVPCSMIIKGTLNPSAMTGLDAAARADFEVTNNIVLKEVK